MESLTFRGCVTPPKRMCILTRLKHDRLPAETGRLDFFDLTTRENERSSVVNVNYVLIRTKYAGTRKPGPIRAQGATDITGSDISFRVSVPFTFRNEIHHVRRVSSVELRAGARIRKPSDGDTQRHRRFFPRARFAIRRKSQSTRASLFAR